jgi:hypothetical protein
MKKPIIILIFVLVAFISAISQGYGEEITVMNEADFEKIKQTLDQKHKSGRSKYWNMLPMREYEQMLRTLASARKTKGKPRTGKYGTIVGRMINAALCQAEGNCVVWVCIVENGDVGLPPVADANCVMLCIKPDEPNKCK